MSKSRFNSIDRLAETFRALSNPHRLRLFLRLMSCCGPEASCGAEDEIDNCAGALGKDLGIAPSTVSHHLKELRVAGLITMERRGKNVECGIDQEVLEELSKLFESRFQDTEVA